MRGEPATIQRVISAAYSRLSYSPWYGWLLQHDPGAEPRAAAAAWCPVAIEPGSSVRVSLAESRSDQSEPATEPTGRIGKTHHVGAFQQKVGS